MSEKQRWGKEAHLGDAVTANQADWWRSWEAGLWSANAQEDSWRKGSLGQKGSSPGSSGLWHISLKKPEIAQFHHLSDILMQSTACSVTFLCSVRANALLLRLWFLRLLESTHSCQWGLHQCHEDAAQLLYLLLFSEGPWWRISVKKHSVKILPSGLN